MSGESHVVIAPDFVVVQRRAGMKPDVLSGVAAVGIKGGKRFQARQGEAYKPGEGVGSKFSFGYMSPEQLVVAMKRGRSASLRGAAQVLFLGGAEDPSGADRILTQLLARPSPMPGARGPHSTEIVSPSDPEVVVLDNDASQRIVDVGVDDGSDFSDLIAKRNAAMAEFDGDDLAAMASLQEGVSQDLQSVAPYVRTAPPSALKGTPGGQATVTSGQSPVLVANWVGDSEVESQAIGVTLGPVQLPTANVDPRAIRAYANIFFGNKGYLNQVVVDFGVGCSFSVYGSQVSVEVGLDAVSAAPQMTRTLTATLSFGVTQKNTTLTRTVYRDTNVAAAGIFSVLRPAFSQNVYLIRNPWTVGPVNIGFFDSASSACGEVELAASATFPAPIPIPNDCAFMIITNNDGANPLTRVRLVFGLGL